MQGRWIEVDVGRKFSWDVTERGRVLHEGGGLNCFRRFVKMTGLRRRQEIIEEPFRTFGMLL